MIDGAVVGILAISSFFAAEVVVDHELIGLATAFMLVSVLFWLIQSREEEAKTKSRRSPVSIDELGRAVFEAAVNADLDGYRDLFLAGGEARDVFGENADLYLQRRGLDVLEEALVTIGALIPPGSRFGGSESLGAVDVAIRVFAPGKNEALLVGIGSVTRIGGVFRIQEPAAQR